MEVTYLLITTGGTNHSNLSDMFYKLYERKVSSPEDPIIPSAENTALLVWN